MQRASRHKRAGQSLIAGRNLVLFSDGLEFAAFPPACNRPATPRLRCCCIGSLLMDLLSTFHPATTGALASSMPNTRRLPAPSLCVEPGRAVAGLVVDGAPRPPHHQ